MSIYTLHIRSSPHGGDLLRCHNRIESLSFAYDKHGNAELEVTLRIPQADAYALYDRPALPHIIVCYAGAPIWAGRLTVPTIGTRTTKLTARGYWDAFTDNPYTALWSTTSVSEWRPILASEIAGSVPDRATFDTNNRVYITANKGATFSNAVSVSAGYIAPDQGERLITNISFDYSFSSQTNWQIAIVSYNSSWGGGAVVWSLNGAGAGTVTGSQSLTLGTPRDRIVLNLYYNAAAAVIAAETGDIFVRITNLRIKTTTAGSVLGSEIAAAMVTYAETINDQLRASIAAASTLDLRDEIYLDTLPADIIDRVASIDGVRAYVDEHGVFWYGQVATGRWQLDVADLEIERPLDRVFNRAYGIYQDSGGNTLRTADADNALSQARYGLIRSTPVDASSSSSSQVTTQRDAALVDTANPAPRASLTVRRVLDSQGRPALPHLPRPGDLAILPALPPTLTSDVDQIRAFVIGRVAISLVRGQRPTVTIEPETPTPTLTTFLARLEALTQRIATAPPSSGTLGPLPFDGPRLDPWEIVEG